MHLLGPTIQIDHTRKPFTNSGLRALIAPLFLEQLLVMLVGIADTLMISYVGEAAVSGVSLVNMINTIFLYLFTAIGSGGAVVVAQCIGAKATDRGSLACGQNYLLGTLFGATSMVLILVVHTSMLSVMYATVTPDVMDAAVIYLAISALSFPFLAVYCTGAALLRSMARTKETMYVSLGANLVNIAGNAAAIFVLFAGVAGVAWTSFAVRVLSAVAVVVLCCGVGNPVRLAARTVFRWDAVMLRRILRIALPTALESVLFQLMKVLLGMIVALFGTSQIAANGVAQSIWSIAALASVAMGPTYITVVGQCLGSGDTAAADYYTRKLLRITFVLSIAWNAFIMALMPLLLMVYSLSPETKELVFWLVLIHSVFNAFVFPLADPFANSLRAAGDVKFTMWANIVCTVGVRMVLSLALALGPGWGVIGIALAMVTDWVFKAVAYTLRYRSGKWQGHEVI